MSSFVSRLVVAAIGLPVVLGAVYLGGWWVAGLALAAAAVALHEFWILARALRPLAPAGYLGGILAVLGTQLGGIDWAVGGMLAALPLAFLLKLVSDTRQAATTSIGATVLGASWIGVGLASLPLIRDVGAHGRLALYTVLLAVWAGDTFAYFGGRLLGRHRMAPLTSPGKTWEGVIFGTAATVFVTFVALYKQHYLSITQSLLLGAAIAIAAPLGDLFESLLKRDMDVKDSGRILGGHGGMLDRVDALLFAGPAAYFCLLAFA